MIRVLALQVSRRKQCRISQTARARQTPEERTSGFLGGLRLSRGDGGLSVIGVVNAEEQQDKLSLGGRLGLQFAF